MRGLEQQAKFPLWRECIGTYPATVIGVDLAGSERRPTGWAALRGAVAQARTLRTDAEILDATLPLRPRIVSIDSPLSLPASGIIRESERELMALRVGVYPCLLPSMRALTHRGIALKLALESHGIQVIEGFPGAAQDALGIPRKKTSEPALRQGLENFGLQIPDGKLTHHELDAITAALIAQFFGKKRYHAFGAPGEVPIITPLTTRRTAKLTSPNPATLRYAANYLALFHGIRLQAKGPTTIPDFPKRPALRDWLYRFVTNAAISLDSSTNDGLYE
jgi:predicted nuclease with RNAse H fold